jgi:LytS/YehU family sensor histidine kinase
MEEEKKESFKLKKNTSAKTCAKIALGLGIFRLFFIGGALADIAFVFAIIFGIMGIAMNKEKDKKTRAMAILGIVLALAGVVIKVLIDFPK